MPIRLSLASPTHNGGVVKRWHRLKPRVAVPMEAGKEPTRGPEGPKSGVQL